MKHVTSLWKTAFFFLLIAGLIGLAMRYQFVGSIEGFNYRNFLHAHSHVILLGWIFNALVAGLHFITIGEKITGRYRILYVLFQLSILGMLFSFPVQGYATISIIFSTLHILLSYVWVSWMWRRTSILDKVSRGFIRWGLFYLLISTVGPFSLGPIIATGGAGTNLYFMAIYFYLHFLYNGAFIFCLLGLFFWFMHKLSINKGRATGSLKLMNISCVLSLFLSALWMQPHPVVYVVGAIAAIIQLIAIFQLIRVFLPIWPSLLSFISGRAVFLLKFVLSGLVLKVILQTISSIPMFADLAYEIRNFTIGYLHLIFLGIITPFLFAWFNLHGMMHLSTPFRKSGMVLFFAGFVFSELVIVSQLWWNGISYYQLLFFASLVLMSGIALLFPIGRSSNIA
ncbi:MAG: hypothetical protein RIM99_10765 [Cyclobacteriaceae bacterium]